jgi:hypothetical protein
METWTSEETNLSDIQVGAVRVQLGVVEVENSGVEAPRSGNFVTGIAELHDIRGGAVLARPAETDAGVGDEVAALGVDVVDVDDGELVTGGGWVCVSGK